MKNKSFISVLIIITILMGTSCSKKEATSEDNTDHSTLQTTTSSTEMTDDTDSSSDHDDTDLSSDPSEESISSSESESSIESSQEEGVSVEEKLVSACEKLGFPLLKGTYDEDSDNYTFVKGSFRIDALVEKDEASAKKDYQEIISYGGWYEEPVLKEIRSEEGDYQLWAVYSDLGDGKKGLFVNYAKENIWLGVETFDEEYIESIEDLLRKLGCDID